MKLIDSHCHIQFKNYNDDRDEILRKCLENDVGLLAVGCEYESSAAAVALADAKRSVWAAVGQHPTDTGIPFVYENFATLARSSRRVVAIGECGLDYFHLPKEPVLARAMKETQKDLFFHHLNLAHECGLPLIIHSRDSHEDLIAILQDRYSAQGLHAIPNREHGVLHCFTGTIDDAQKYLELGFLISFTGIITFADQYDEVVRMVPLEKILVETDAPFLAPIPYRGKKNVPTHIRFVVERIAQLKGISFDEVAETTTKNTQRLFKLV